ncbi:hypothetical protein SARC_10606, partial [Sphaeroforma arctica JP610]
MFTINVSYILFYSSVAPPQVNATFFDESGASAPFVFEEPVKLPVGVRPKPSYPPFDVNEANAPFCTSDVLAKYSLPDTKKESLLKRIDKVDSEISQLEQRLKNVYDERERGQEELHLAMQDLDASKRLKASLEQSLSEKIGEKDPEITEAEEPDTDTHLHLAVNAEEVVDGILMANARIAEKSHKLAQVKNLFPKDLEVGDQMVLYNRPDDIPTFASIFRNHAYFRPTLLGYLKRTNAAQQLKIKRLQIAYRKYHEAWEARIERQEAIANKSGRAQRQKAFFEAQFPDMARGLPPTRAEDNINNHYTTAPFNVSELHGMVCARVRTDACVRLTRMRTVACERLTRMHWKVFARGHRGEVAVAPTADPSHLSLDVGGPPGWGGRSSRTSRSSGWGDAVRSDAEMEQVLLDLLAQERSDEKSFTALAAVVPPLILNKKEKAMRYDNRNGLVVDLPTDIMEHKMKMPWRDSEREIFSEKYLLYPKDFGKIQTYIPSHTVSECVAYYYASKKKEKYKMRLQAYHAKRKRTHEKEKERSERGDHTEDAQASQHRKDRNKFKTKPRSRHHDGVNTPPSRKGLGVARLDSTSSTTSRPDKSIDHNLFTVPDHPGRGRPTDKEREARANAARDKDKDESAHHKRRKQKSSSQSGSRRRNKEYDTDTHAHIATGDRDYREKGPITVHAFTHAPKDADKPGRKDRGSRTVTDDEDDEGGGIAVSRTSTITLADGTVEVLGPQLAALQATVAGNAAHGAHIEETARWSQAETELLIRLLGEVGRDWVALSQVIITKSDTQCKNYFHNNKRRLNLAEIVAQCELNRQGEGDKETGNQLVEAAVVVGLEMVGKRKAQKEMRTRRASEKNVATLDTHSDDDADANADVDAQADADGDGDREGEGEGEGYSDGESDGPPSAEEESETPAEVVGKIKYKHRDKEKEKEKEREREKEKEKEREKEKEKEKDARVHGHRQGTATEAGGAQKKRKSKSRQTSPRPNKRRKSESTIISLSVPVSRQTSVPKGGESAASEDEGEAKPHSVSISRKSSVKRTGQHGHSEKDKGKVSHKTR